MEWKEDIIKDLADVKGGKRLPKGKQLIQQRNTHPYIRIRDLGKNKILQLNDEYEYVDDETQQAIERYIVHSGDILISVVGTIGLVAIVGDTLDGANQTENCDKIINLRGIDNNYLYYYLISSIGQEEIKRGTVGAVQPKLPLKNVQNINVKYPPLEDQKRIVSILNAIDEKMIINEKINRNLQDQAFAIFDELVSKHDECVELREIADINPKRTLSKGTIAKCIDMAKLSTTGAFPDGWDEKAYSGGVKFANGDTLLARITPCLENGKTAYINFLDEDEIAFGSTEYVVLSSKEDTPPELLYCLARYPKFVEYAVKNMNGSSGRQRVSGETIGDYQVSNFSKEDFDYFRDAVSPFFEIMKVNSLANKRLEEIRDSLLPKLMSGEIDVSNLDI